METEKLLPESSLSPGVDNFGQLKCLGWFYDLDCNIFLALCPFCSSLFLGLTPEHHLIFAIIHDDDVTI